MLHERRAAPPPLAPVPVPDDHDHDDVHVDGDAAAAGKNDDDEFRDIHPLTPPARTGTAASSVWDTASSRRSFSSEEQFMTMSREFTAMVAAGATDIGDANNPGAADQLSSIGEDEQLEETNPLAIVPGSHPIAATRSSSSSSGSRAAPCLDVVPAPPPAAVEARQVKKEEVESKVSAWQTAEVAKINSRFRREEVVINGWEKEQLEKASACLKKIERKLEERRAKAAEKTENEVARARRKAEERRASAEAKRGLKLAKVLELAGFMKAVGRVPARRSFFSS